MITEYVRYYLIIEIFKVMITEININFLWLDYSKFEL